MLDDFGRYSWALRTCGRMKFRRRMRSLVTVVASFPAFVYHRILQRGPRKKHRELTARQLQAPSPKSKNVQQVAGPAARSRQSPAMAQHGFRTWKFGYALARLDERHGHLDADLFYLAALFHDSGLMRVVADECFTLRSAAVVSDVAREAKKAEPANLLKLQDAVVDHITPGITKRNTDRLMAVYVQQGTMADLTGYRIKSLPEDFVAEVLAEYPRHRVDREVCGRWRGEAGAVRHGRAHFLQRWGRITWFFAHPPRVLRKASDRTAETCSEPTSPGGDL